MFAILGNILETGKEIFWRRFQGVDVWFDSPWFCFTTNTVGDEETMSQEITRWIEPPRTFSEQSGFASCKRGVWGHLRPEIY